jgi:hypothetical protein
MRTRASGNPACDGLLRPVFIPLYPARTPVIRRLMAHCAPGGRGKGHIAITKIVAQILIRTMRSLS